MRDFIIILVTWCLAFYMGVMLVKDNTVVMMYFDEIHPHFGKCNYSFSKDGVKEYFCATFKD